MLSIAYLHLCSQHGAANAPNIVNYRLLCTESKIFLSALTGSIIFSPLQLDCRSTPNQKNGLFNFPNASDKEVKTCHNTTAAGRKKTFLSLLSVFQKSFTFTRWSKDITIQPEVKAGLNSGIFPFKLILKTSAMCCIALHCNVLLRAFLFPGQVHIGITASVGCCMCYCDAQYIFMNNVSRP